MDYHDWVRLAFGMSGPETMFLDDAPKREPGADRLGHAGFAARLASVLATLDAPEGYVIGMHGPWGSGKSTILNFVGSDLAARSAESGNGPTIIRFEPWIISGHQDVTGAFMKVLAEHLPQEEKGFWKRWGKRGLRAAKTGGSDIIDAVAKIGVVADHTGGIASGAAGGVAKKAIDAAADKWLKEPSLQATYAELVKRLRALGQRFVVVVDDIERLTADEIRDLMKMVKTLGKLPNVIYLLAYDRSIVWRALATIDPDPRAGAFAEKIVQHEVELPLPSRNALLAMLSEALEFLALDPDAVERRSELVSAGIAHWIRQPRDVVRLSNGLRFAWSALAGEIDADDLLCMEALKLHDRDLFEWIRDNREALIERAMPYSDEDKTKFAEKFVQRFAGTRANAANLMRLLFPNRGELFRTHRYGMGGEVWTSVQTRRGIATPAGYEAYFSLHPVATVIPKALVDRAIAASEDQDAIEAILREGLERRDEAGNTLIGSLLEEIRSRHDRGAPATRALFVALTRLGNDIAWSPWTGDLFTPRTHLHFLVTDMLKRWDDETRFANLQMAYTADAPLAALAALHIDIARAIGVLPREGVEHENYVTRAQFAELGALVMARIDEARTAGSLDEQPVYYDIARAWAIERGFEEPQSWISEIAVSSASRLARVALGLLGYSRSVRGRHFSLSGKPDTELYEVDKLLEACALHADARDVTEDERARIAALGRGLRNLREPSLEDAVDDDREGGFESPEEADDFDRR